MQDKEKNKKQPGILETVHMVNEKEKKKGIFSTSSLDSRPYEISREKPK